MPTPLTDADKVLRNDTGKDIVTQLTSIASSIATPASLVGLSDTAITTPTDGQELTYNSSLSKWNNKTTRVELTQQQYDLLVANNEDLPDVDYYITDAGGAEVVSSAPNISDVYNPNTTYNTGDLCIYNNVLYKCKTDNVTGAWDGTKWDRTTVDNVIGDLSQLTTTDKSSLVGSVNEVNANKADKSALTWTLLGETTGTAEQNLPTTWNEIQVYGMFGGNAQYGFVAHTIYAHIGSNPSRYIQGGADKEGGTDHHIAIWHIESGKIGLNFWRYNNTDYTSTAKLIVYYR